MTSPRVYSDWLPGQRANRRHEMPAIVCVFLSTPESPTSGAQSPRRPDSIVSPLACAGAEYGTSTANGPDQATSIMGQACRYLIGSRGSCATSGGSDD